MLLLGILAIGTLFGLYANGIRRQRAAIAQVHRLGGTVVFDYQKAAGSDQGNVFDYKATPPAPRWLRPILGAEPFRAVVRIDLRGRPITDQDLRVLSAFPRLENLDLSHCPITSAGLVHIAGLTRLKVLSLDDTRVDDRGLQHLSKMTDLRLLTLDCTSVSDAGLQHLEGLTNLSEWLGLVGTRVTDAGLVHLRGLKKLQSLNLRLTGVTASGAKHLGQALPKTMISYSQGGADRAVWPKR